MSLILRHNQKILDKNILDMLGKSRHIYIELYTRNLRINKRFEGYLNQYYTAFIIMNHDQNIDIDIFLILHCVNLLIPAVLRVLS